MTVSPVKAILTGTVIALTAIGGAAFPALGQGAGPVILSTPKRLKPAVRPAPAAAGTAGQAAKRNGYQAQPVGRSLSGIQIDKLGAVDPDGTGILDGAQGGFGMNLWQGSRLPFVKRLLAEHPERVKSHVMRRLLRRVLLSAATPPQGAENTGFTAVRLRALLAMGEYKAGLELLDAIPRKNREAAFLTLETELRLATGKAAKACAVAAAEVTRRREVFWQKALIYCQILAGETDKADFALTLLRETGTPDAVFLALAESMIAGDPKLPDAIGDIDLLHLAMLKTAKLDLPLGVARRYPAALMAITENPAAANRLDAIEIAAEEGLLADDDLMKRYAAALPPAGSVVQGAGAAATSLDRARLFAEARRINVPIAKAEALNQVMGGARKSARLGGVSRLFGPVVKSLAPGNDLLWMAPTAFRMLLLTGDNERAGLWFALAQRNAAVSPDAGKLYRGLSLLDALARVSPRTGRKPPPLTGLSPDQSILYLGLFHELGGEVPLELLEGLIYRSERPAPLPDPVLWRRLQRLNDQKIAPVAARADVVPTVRSAAAAADSSQAGKVVGPTVVAQALAPPPSGGPPPRLGERILMMLAVMGDRPLDELSPLVAAEVVRGLRQAGLTVEARSFAMEVAINAGL